MAIDFIHPAAIYRLTPLDLGPFGRPRSSFNSAVLMPFLMLACDISGDPVGICTFSKTYQQNDHAKRAVAYLSSTRAWPRKVDERTFERCEACQCREPYGSDTAGGNRYRIIQTIKHTHVQRSFLERWCVTWLNVPTAVIFIILHKMVAKNCQAVHYTFKAAFVALGRPLLLGTCPRVWHSSMKWTSAGLNT